MTSTPTTERDADYPNALLVGRLREFAELLEANPSLPGMSVNLARDWDGGAQPHGVASDSVEAVHEAGRVLGLPVEVTEPGSYVSHDVAMTLPSGYVVKLFAHGQRRPLCSCVPDDGEVGRLRLEIDAACPQHAGLYGGPRLTDEEIAEAGDLC